MAVSKDDILEAISNMTVMEVVDLISAMEEKFGVSAAAAVAAAPAAAGGDAGAAVEEKDEFDVVMTSFGGMISMPFNILWIFLKSNAAACGFVKNSSLFCDT